ncbi:MAG: mechanosensitive ion channel [Ardenticatenales bacterium]|nr:mechanosensitive ion channel [Ardenticatenales bacterium]
MELADTDWSIVAIRGGTILAVWLAAWLLNRFLVRWIKTADRLVDTLEFSETDVRVLGRLTSIVLLVAGLGITVSVLGLAPLLWASAIVWRTIALVLVWTAAWVLVRYFSQWIKAADEQIEGIDIGSRDLKTLDRLLDYVFIIVAAIISMAILEITPLLYSALTAAGVIGIIIGFAVKDVASNFISGILIMIDRPFVVGDTIMIKDYSGTVKRISLRSTELVTFDGPIVTIPNSAVATEPTTNYTLSRHRRVLFTVSVLCTTDLNLAIETIQSVLEAEERLLPEKPPSILIGEIRDSAVDIQVIAYTRKEDVFAAQSDLKREIVASFSRHGVDLAVPLRMNLSPVVPPQVPG